jgi:hypothetical protein
MCCCVQKSDVEVFFEDVERPPGLPRANAAGGSQPATTGMQPQIGAAGQQQQKAAGTGAAQAAPTAGMLRQ